MKTSMVSNHSRKPRCSRRRGPDSHGAGRDLKGASLRPAPALRPSTTLTEHNPNRWHLPISADIKYDLVMSKTIETRMRPLLRKNAVIRTRDLKRLGIPRTALQTPLAEGSISRIGRGVYSVAGHLTSEHHGMAQATARVPNGVICLISALVFHEITTQSPHEIWLAVDRKARQPLDGFPPLHVVRFGGEALFAGTMTQEIDGVQVRITTVAKTIADCFKYRNKIGISIAVEALREAWNQKKFAMDDLSEMARVCRVQNVIRPYLEAMQ
jgi:predicted transcriptional regulator of viral defense system